MSAPVRFARKRLDLDVADLGYGLTRCLHAPARRTVLAELSGLWTPPDTVLVTLSVRSGLDLLLAEVDWPPGSEVLLSAITIPHIATLVRMHGYVPVALDVDPDTLELRPDDVRAACTPRTRALVYAHLFGARSELEPLVTVIRQAGLLLIDDRAECYDGLDRSIGPVVDVAMHSFGTIKTATCLGGGVLLIRDPTLRRRMQRRQRTWPTQSTAGYAAKLVQGALMLALGHPTVYPVFVAATTRLGGDYDLAIRRLSRGYSDANLLPAIRRRPSCALLAMLARRLRRYDPAGVTARRHAGEVLSAALAPPSRLLGAAALGHTYWLFPLVSRDPDRLVAAGRAAGFDVTRGSSTLVALDPACAGQPRPCPAWSTCPRTPG